MKSLFLITFIFFYVIIAAQSADNVINTNINNEKSKYDTSYIYQFNRKFVLKSIIASRNFSLHIVPKTISDIQEDLSLKYKANVSNYFGVGGSYNNLYLQLLFSIPNSQKDETEYGSTEYTDLNLSFHHDKLSEAFFYKNFKGLYSDYGYSSTDSIEHRNDIALLKTGIRLFYLFNDKYSIHAVYKQTQLQKKSVGTPIVRMDAYYQRISSDSSIFNTEKQGSYYTQIDKLRKIENYVLNLQIGYSYNFVFAKYFYISPLAFMGLGPQQVRYDNPNLKKYSINYSANLKILAGYTRKRFVAGIIFDGQYHFTPSKSAIIYTNSPFLQFSIGYRFDI